MYFIIKTIIENFLHIIYAIVKYKKLVLNMAHCIAQLLNFTI